MSNISNIPGDELITSSRAKINANFTALNNEKIETSVISTDNTLGGASPSNSKLPTEKAIKDYVDVTASPTGKSWNEYAIANSGTDSYTITVPGVTALVAGQTFKFKADVPNTGACTLNVNGLGAKGIKTNVSDDLKTGAILQNQIVIVSYDGTNMQVSSATSVGSMVIDLFTTNGTWNKRDGAKIVRVIGQGAGGGAGGGGGAYWATTAPGIRYSGAGGSGGGGGALFDIEYLADNLPSSVSVTVGIGGTGGTGGVSGNQAIGGAGSNGTAGGNSTFGSLLTALGGNAGAGGGGGGYNSDGLIGSNAASVNSIFSESKYRGGGTNLSSFYGGAGGGSGSLSGGNTYAGKSGSLVDSNGPSNSEALASVQINSPLFAGTGGGGSSVDRGNGFNGSIGCGGGGGNGVAASYGGTPPTAGNGGNGGNGIVAVITYF